MPLTTDILSKHVNPVFIETGTYHCEAVEMALRLKFDTVHTIEYDPGLAATARTRYLANPRVKTYVGDSADQLVPIIKSLSQPTTFWLDAHPLVTPMPLFNPDFPLLREILVLKRFLPTIPCVLLMDDMRTFSKEELDMLTFAMKQLWPRAAHSFYSDHLATDDVYCCVIQGK